MTQTRETAVQPRQPAAPPGSSGLAFHIAAPTPLADLVRHELGG